MRTGVLSDAVIRNSYPEFFPLEMGLADAIEEVVFEKHHLTGIRLPKEYKRRRNSRFPINDINNFTVLSGGADTKERNVYQAIQAYRKRFGSTNYYEDASQNQQYNDIMYMGKNYEMRRRGLVVDKLDMDSLPQAMIMSRMLSRNKDEIIDMNRKTRTSTVSMSQLENKMNSAITSNLEGAKNMLLQVAPEIRRSSDFQDALLNVNLQTRYRQNNAYMTKDTAIQQTNTYKNMILKEVDLPTDAKYGYGSARDKVLEDQYLRITGLSRPEESIKEVTTETEEFYNVKPSPLIRKTQASSMGIIENLDETDLPLEEEPRKSGIEEEIPEDLTKYIKDREAKAREDPEYLAEDVALSNRLDEINERMDEVNRDYEAGRDNYLLRDAYRLSPYSNRISLTEQGDPYRKTNISLTDQAIKTEEGEIIRKKKKDTRTMMLAEYERVTGAGHSRIPHHGEADVDGSGYVRIHPTNSLLASVLNPTPPPTGLRPSSSRMRLERAIAYSSTFEEPMTTQELEYLRRSDNSARLQAEMEREQAREDENDRYWAPD